MSTVVRDEQPGTSTAHPDRSPLPPQLLLTEEGGDQIIADQGLGSGLVVGNAGVAVYTNSTKEAGVLRSSFPVEGQLALSTDVGRFNELLTQTARSAATTQDVTAGLTTTIRVQDGATIAIGGPGIDNTFEMHFTAVPSTEQQWTSEWAPRPPQLSEEDFYRLAEEAPDQLIALVNANTLRPSDLTFAAEALGEVHSSPAKGLCYGCFRMMPPWFVKALSMASPIILMRMPGQHCEELASPTRAQVSGSPHWKYSPSKMAPILLRVCRRKTAFERDDTPIEEKLLAEFKRDGKPDLRPSVYEIEPDGDLVVQTRAEHSASAGAYPQRGTNIDFSGASQILRTAGDSRFRMTQEAHREVVFESQEQLLQFLEEQISSNLAVRQHATTKPQLIGYVKGRIAEKDEEWLSFCRDGKKRHHWGCLEVASPAPTPAQVGGPIHKRLFTKLQEVFLAVRRLWR